MASSGGHLWLPLLLPLLLLAKPAPLAAALLGGAVSLALALALALALLLALAPVADELPPAGSPSTWLTRASNDTMGATSESDISSKTAAWNCSAYTDASRKFTSIWQVRVARL
jgi:amino acid transporter